MSATGTTSFNFPINIYESPGTQTVTCNMLSSTGTGTTTYNYATLQFNSIISSFASSGNFNYSFLFSTGTTGPTGLTGITGSTGATGQQDLRELLALPELLDLLEPPVQQDLRGLQE